MRRTAIALCLAGALGACTSDPPSPTPLVTVTPAWTETLGPVRPGVLGHNTVWSRGGLGLWDDAAGAPHAGVEQLVTDLHPGVLRFPGGTRAMRYHFAQAVGPLAQRTPQCDAFNGMRDATGYGLDEFLALAERTGAQVSLVSPWVDGSPQEAAALIAYANADPASTVPLGTDANGVDWGTAGDWAARRAQNGHPTPYGVAYLEIGNEQYLDLPVGPAESCGRAGRFRQSERWVGDTKIPTTAADHAAQVALTGALVHAVDPAVLVGASAFAEYDGAADATTAVANVDADLATGDAWNARLVADAADGFDFFVLHPYDFASVDERLTLAERLRKVVHDLRAFAPEKQVAVTEFGFLFDGDTLLNALVSADMVRVGVEEQLVMTVRHILIEDDPDEPFANAAALLGPTHQRTPGYEALRLLATTLQADAVPVVGSEPDVVVLATRSGDGDTVALAIIDRRLGLMLAPVTVAISLPADGTWAGEQQVLSGASILARAQDTTLLATPVGATRDTLRIALPVNALAVVRLTRQAP